MYFAVNGLEDRLPVLIEAEDVKELKQMTKELWGHDNILIRAVFQTIPENPDYPEFYFER